MTSGLQVGAALALLSLAPAAAAQDATARPLSGSTLVISGPGGEWVCDDDSGPEHNAEVVFDKPESGVYDVWVGTYGGGTWPRISSSPEASRLRAGTVTCR